MEGRCGRPTVPQDVRELIRRMSRENPLWGAPGIHGELLKLGIDTSVRLPDTAHDRRRILHGGVTAHSTAEWPPSNSEKRFRGRRLRAICCGTGTARELKRQFLRATAS